MPIGVFILKEWEIDPVKTEAVEKTITALENMIFDGERVAHVEWFVNIREQPPAGVKHMDFFDLADASEKTIGYFHSPDRIFIHAGLDLKETVEAAAHEMWHLVQFRNKHFKLLDDEQAEDAARRFGKNFGESPFCRELLSSLSKPRHLPVSFDLGGGSPAGSLQRCVQVPAEDVPYPFREQISFAVSEVVRRAGAEWLFGAISAFYYAASPAGYALLPWGCAGRARYAGGRLELYLRADIPARQAAAAAQQAVYKIAAAYSK